VKAAPGPKPKPAATDAPETVNETPLGRCAAHGSRRGRHARSDAAGGPGGAAGRSAGPAAPAKRPPTPVRDAARDADRSSGRRPPRSRRTAEPEIEVFYTFTWAPRRRRRPSAAPCRGWRRQAARSEAEGRRQAARQGRQGPGGKGRQDRDRAPSRPAREARQGRSRQSLRGSGRAQGQVLSEPRPDRPAGPVAVACAVLQDPLACREDRQRRRRAREWHPHRPSPRQAWGPAMS
jgi:ATP-dependent RNA helicase SUPV3L1/SUV3